MNRKTQTQTFNSTFPSVDLKTTAGVLMFQGYLGGYAKCEEKYLNTFNSLRKKITCLEQEIKDLNAHISNMNVMIKKQDEWMKTGDEA